MRWFLFFILAALGSWLIYLLPAKAHHAPSGWQYPNECCRNHQDCQMIHKRNVEITPEGYRVTLKPGEHRHAPEGGTHFFPHAYGSKMNGQIRDSGDNDWHVCIATYQNYGYFGDEGIGHVPNTESSTDLIWRCIYVPGGEV